jgi:hypothetical protein
MLAAIGNALRAASRPSWVVRHCGDDLQGVRRLGSRHGSHPTTCTALDCRGPLERSHPNLGRGRLTMRLVNVPNDTWLQALIAFAAERPGDAVFSHIRAVLSAPLPNADDSSYSVRLRPRSAITFARRCRATDCREGRHVLF